MSDLRQRILEANDMVMEKVHVDEWDVDVYVKRLSGKERDRFEASLSRIVGGKQELTLENTRAKLLLVSLCDEDGKLIFDRGDLEMLGSKSAIALDKLFDVAQKLSGFGPAQVEELKKT